MTKEQDKRIAVEVMRWQKVVLTLGGYYWVDKELCKQHDEGFHPTTDANDDFLVLKYIRENWIVSKRSKWREALREITSERVIKDDFHKLHPAEVVIYYEPGDFSRAALKVLDDEKTDH